MATKWNADIQFPTDSNFIVRITDVTFGDSKRSGNAMLTWEYELVAPQQVDVGGKMVEIAGVACKDYSVVTVFKKDGTVDEEASADKRQKVKERFQMLFPENPERWENINWENPDVSGCKGLCIYTMMSPDVDPQHKNPTQAELEDAKKKGIDPSKAGAILKNPVTGKPLVKYWPKVREVFGLAPKDAAANVPY